MDNTTFLVDLAAPSLRTEIPGFELLTELALNLRWSWNHASDEIWVRLDESTWRLTNNPWVVLQTVSRVDAEAALQDDAFRRKVMALLRESRRSVERPAWFQKTHPSTQLRCVAYFSMEYMLSEALPIYSGGPGERGW